MANRKGPVTFEVPESIDVDALRENVVRQQILDEDPGPNLAAHLLGKTFLGRRRVGDPCEPQCATFEEHERRMDIEHQTAIFRAFMSSMNEPVKVKHPDNLLAHTHRSRRAR